jgi:short-subunit dehydrogenase
VTGDGPLTAFAERYGPWALIAGAAEGIGAAFASELAARGVNLMLVDINEEKLDATVAPLREQVELRTLVANLADAAALDAIVEDAAAVDLGLLIYNAGISYVGPFREQTLESSLAQLDINVRAPLVLVHRLLPALLARRRGGLILLSSQSAMRGAPLVATYAATKAWALVLGEGLWEELRHDGIDALAVLPGSTRTPGWLASQPQSSLGTSNVMEPSDVAREALDTLGERPSLIVGQDNRDADAFIATMDRRDAVAMMGDVMRSMYPSEREPDPTV